MTKTITYTKFDLSCPFTLSCAHSEVMQEVSDSRKSHRKSSSVSYVHNAWGIFLFKPNYIRSWSLRHKYKKSRMNTKKK
jgi:hypothetical protein